MFESYTDQNNLQFSASYLTHYLESTGTVTLDTGYAPYGTQGATQYTSANGIAEAYKNVSGQFIPTDTLVALRCSTAAVYLMYVADINNSSLFWKAFSLSQNVQVEYWVFQPTSKLTPRSSGVGLELYTPQGTLAYDSGRSPLKYHSVYSIGALTNPTNRTVSLPSGASYAYILDNVSMFEHRVVSTGTPTYVQQPGTLTGSYEPGPNASVSGVQSVSGGFNISLIGPDVTYTQGPKNDGLVKVVDVTNI